MRGVLTSTVGSIISSGYCPLLVMWGTIVTSNADWGDYGYPSPLRDPARVKISRLTSHFGQRDLRTEQNTQNMEFVTSIFCSKPQV